MLLDHVMKYRIYRGVQMYKGGGGLLGREAYFALNTVDLLSVNILKKSRFEQRHDFVDSPRNSA